MPSLNRKFLIVFLSILLLASFLRLQYLDKPLQRDEQAVFFDTVNNMINNRIPTYRDNYLDEHGRILIIFDAHTPLYLVYLSTIAFLVKSSVFWLRVSMVIFSILTVILVYFVGTEIGGRNVGLLSSFILAILRLHVEHSQILDIDGSFLTFFVLLSTFLVLKWFKYNEFPYFILSILSLSITILVKESAILVFPTLFIILYKKRKLSSFFYICISAFTIVVLFLHLYNSLFSANIFTGILKAVNGFVYKQTLTNDLTRLVNFTGIFTWELTPPLLVLSLIAIFYTWKIKDETLRFLIYVISFYSVFFILILGLTRYFVPILPLISILLANFLLSIKPNFIFSRIKIILILSSLTVLIFYLMRIRTDHAFLNDISSNLYLISIPYIITLIPTLLLFTKYRKFSILVLFAILIGFNLYFSQEAVNSLITPDFSKSTLFASELIKINNITGPIITSGDLGSFANIDYYNIEHPRTNLEFIRKLINENKVQYVIYRTNSIPISEDVKNYLDVNCKKIETYLDKNVEILRAYICE